MGEREFPAVPFRFKGVHGCKAIAITPTGFNVRKEIRGFMGFNLGYKSYDLFSIPSFTKRYERESETAMRTIEIAEKLHGIEDAVIFQTTDFHDGGKSTRFANRFEENYFHQQGLVAARSKMLFNHPHINARMIYVSIDQEERFIFFHEIHEEEGAVQLELLAKVPYRFKGVYGCDTAVMMCMDFRFRRETISFVEDYRKVQSFELIGLPGSAKRFTEESQTAQKAAQLAIKGGVREFYIVHHADCGAYGGAAIFKTPQEEELFHRSELKKMKKMLLGEYSKLKIFPTYARLLGDQEWIQYVVF